jgi:hypothetical protein
MDRMVDMDVTERRVEVRKVSLALTFSLTPGASQGGKPDAPLARVVLDSDESMHQIGLAKMLALNCAKPAGTPVYADGTTWTSAPCHDESDLPMFRALGDIIGLESTQIVAMVIEAEENPVLEVEANRYRLHCTATLFVC